MKNGNHKIVITSEMVSLYTEKISFERRSFIHNALMNRDVASIFTSSFITGIFISIYSIGATIGIYELTGFILIFALLFILLRSTVFREKILRVDFIKDNKTVRIFHPGIIGKKVEEFHINEVKSLSVSKFTMSMKNPDAIEVVRRISYQHGTQLGISSEEEVLYVLGFDMKDGSSKVIYVDKSMNTVNNLLRDLERFILFIRGRTIYAQEKGH